VVASSFTKQTLAEASMTAKIDIVPYGAPRSISRNIPSWLNVWIQRYLRTRSSSGEQPAQLWAKLCQFDPNAEDAHRFQEISQAFALTKRTGRTTFSIDGGGFESSEIERGAPYRTTVDLSQSWKLRPAFV